MSNRHNEKVEEIKAILRGLNLPILPPHLVYCDSYHPDLCTRIDEGFMVMDYVNSEGQFNWDIGGLCILLLHKDIIEYCVAVVAEGIFDELIGKIKRHRSLFLDRLVILKESKFRDWLRERVEKSKPWKPEELVMK